MSDKDARVEAARRFSDIDGCPVAITQSQRDAFVAGAKWARESVLAEGISSFELAQRARSIDVVLDRAASETGEER